MIEFLIVGIAIIVAWVLYDLTDQDIVMEKAEKMTFQDKFDSILVKMQIMSPLSQFDRYLHRHNIEHIHPIPNLIVRTQEEKITATYEIYGDNLELLQELQEKLMGKDVYYKNGKTRIGRVKNTWIVNKVLHVEIDTEVTIDAST